MAAYELLSLLHEHRSAGQFNHTADVRANVSRQGTREKPSKHACFILSLYNDTDDGCTEKKTDRYLQSL